MSDWPTPKMRTAADLAALDAVNDQGGTLSQMVRAGVKAALDAAPKAEGWVWCDRVRTFFPQIHVSHGRDGEPHTCKGPHRTLIVGPEVDHE